MKIVKITCVLLLSVASARCIAMEQPDNVLLLLKQQKAAASGLAKLLSAWQEGNEYEDDGEVFPMGKIERSIHIQIGVIEKIANELELNTGISEDSNKIEKLKKKEKSR